MKTEQVLSLLKSMSLNYPILREWNCIFPKVIRLIVPSGDALLTVNTLCTPTSKLVRCDCNDKAIQNMVKQTNSGALFVLGSESDRTKRILKTFADHASSGANALFVYVTDNEMLPPGDIFFDIYLEDSSISCLPINRLVPKASELELVKDIIATRAPLEEAEEYERTLLASACFLYPGFPEDQKSLLDGYFETVQTLCDRNEMNSDSESILNLFLRALYQHLETGEIREAVELPNVESRYIDAKDTCVFYDDQYVYLTQELFRKVIERLPNISAINVKKVLSDEGVLIHDRKIFTTKMLLNRAYGNSDRIRAMKFHKDLLALPGALRFIDLCMERRKQNEDRVREG